MHKSSLVLFALAASAAAMANASSITYYTPLGAMDNGSSPSPVDASALITTNSNGTITVVLSDLETSWQDAGQLLTDFSLTLSSSPTGVPSTATPTGSLITIAGNGSSAADTVDSVLAWNLTTSGASVTLTWPAGGQGQEIIGPGPYTSANSSIAGNGPHNPFLDGTATFTFAAGVTASTTVTAATFSFGTQAGDDITGTPVCSTNCGGVVTGGQTPEPATMLMALSGIGMVGFSAWRKRKKA